MSASLINTKPVPLAWMKLLSNFAATWGRFDGPFFGIHCARCQQDVQAVNGLNDETLIVKCKCGEYVAENRLSIL
jgi:hypothetical protein